MIYNYKILILFVIVSFVSCKSTDKEKDSPTGINDTNTLIPPTRSDSITSGIPYDSILATAKSIMQYIKAKDFANVSAFVSTDSGLRFSSKAYISKKDLQLTKEEVSGLLTNGKKYTWGIGDASGEPIYSTFADYYTTFIYSNDFVNATKIEINKTLRSNTTSTTNFQEIYQGSVNVDFHFPNSKEDLFDWATLRLIFVNEKGSWYLRHLQHERYSI